MRRSNSNAGHRTANADRRHRYRDTPGNPDDRSQPQRNSSNCTFANAGDCISADKSGCHAYDHTDAVAHAIGYADRAG